MGFFKIKPKAKIKLNGTFLGHKFAGTAAGYVIYSEYDSSDRATYYWEEWELRGFNEYDSWIEYDHYEKTVTLYEPLKPREFFDASKLTINQEISFTTRRGESIQAVVSEIGVGTVARREGTLTYHVFEKDTVAYANCRGRQGTFVVETYNDKEFDIYRATALSKAAQKSLLGRVVQPTDISLGVIAWVIFILSFIGVSAYSESKYPNTDCTPRTTTGSIMSQIARPASMSLTLAQQTLPSDPSTTTSQTTCSSRGVYGGGGSYGK